MMGYYCVIQFIKPPNKDTEKHVIVPTSWIVRKLESMQPGTVVVAYPEDGPEIIAQRVQKKRVYKKSWTRYLAIAKYLAKYFDEAESWIEMYNEHMDASLKLAIAKAGNKKPINTLQCELIENKHSETKARTEQSTEVIARTTKQSRALCDSLTASKVNKAQIKNTQTNSIEVAAKRKLPMDSKNFDVKRLIISGSTPKNHFLQSPERFHKQQASEDSRDIFLKDCYDREAAESSIEQKNYFPQSIRHRSSAIESFRLLLKQPQANERVSTSSSNDDHLQQVHGRQEEQDKRTNAISNINPENEISMNTLLPSMKFKISAGQSNCVQESSHRVSRSNKVMLEKSTKVGCNQRMPTQLIRKISPVVMQTVSHVGKQPFLVSENSNDEPYSKTFNTKDELFFNQTIITENIEMDGTYQTPPSQSITKIERQFQPQNTLTTTTERNPLEQNHSYQNITPFVHHLPNVYRPISQLSSNKNIKPSNNNHTPYYEEGPLAQNIYAGGSIIADCNYQRPHNPEHPKNVSHNNMSLAVQNFQTNQPERFPISNLRSKGTFGGRSNSIRQSISPKMNIEDRLSAAHYSLKNEYIDNYSFDDIKHDRFSPISVHSSDQDMSSDELYIDENNSPQNTQIEEHQLSLNDVHACFENRNLLAVAGNEIKHEKCIESDETFEKIMDEIIRGIPSTSEDITEIREIKDIKTETREFSRDNDDCDIYKAPNRENNRNERSFVLPPVFNPNDDDRWTLKHPNATPGVTELIPYSRVYIDTISLFYCKSKAEDCKKLARMLLTEIFSLNALMICSMSGPRIHFKSTKDDSCYVRPGLDKHALMVLVSFVIKYGTRKRWSYCNAPCILESLRYRIKYIRKKFGNN